jgi:hypothetical protein
VNFVLFVQLDKEKVNYVIHYQMVELISFNDTVKALSLYKYLKIIGSFTRGV